MPLHSALITIMEKAARKAAPRLRRDFNEVDALQVSRKGVSDFVSNADRAAEATIREILTHARPDWGLVMEEAGEIKGANDQARWIVDPLDGTTNFVHGFPVFAVSIAAQVRGRLEVATVYDPLRLELFTATRGAGAQLENHKIRVSKQRTLEGALLATGFPYSATVNLDAYLAMLRTIMPQVAGVRRPGAAALDLAYVAAGRVDGFWEMGLQPWDTAAGALLVQEAGGHISALDGGPYQHGGDVLAGSPKVHAAMQSAFAPHLVTPLRARETGTVEPDRVETA